MYKENTEKYSVWILLGAMSVFLFFLFKPFLIILILAFFFSIVFAPIYSWIKKHTWNISWIAALLTTLLFLVIVGVPIFLIGLMIVRELTSVYHSLLAAEGSIQAALNQLSYHVSRVVPVDFSLNIHDRVLNLVSVVPDKIGELFTTTITTLTSFFLLTLSLFYFLKDASYFKKTLRTLSPLSQENTEKVFTKIKQALNGILRGYLLITITQAFCMVVGLTIFGVPNALLWGVLAGLSSMIPVVGTGLIAIPSIIFLFSIGHIGHAIGLLFWCIFLVGGIDNLLSPYIVGSKINLSPLFILFSVLGGVALLGPVGILIGPISLSFVSVLYSIYIDMLKSQ